MKTDINSPAVSKINWTVGVTSLANIGVLMAHNAGYIPDNLVPDVLVVGNVSAGGLIAVFRTWFTKP